MTQFCSNCGKPNTDTAVACVACERPFKKVKKVELSAHDEAELRLAARRQQAQPLIEGAIRYLSNARKSRDRTSDDGYIDLGRIAVEVMYAIKHLRGVEGLTGDTAGVGSGIDDTVRALTSVKGTLDFFWPSEDRRLREASLAIFDAIVPAEMEHLAFDPFGDRRYAEQCRLDEERYGKQESEG